ncbi:hypothetical protein V5F53_13400 [Xanthobacter sp. V4C-4]|uniref:beta strand repeat-containing protein n=1 Tax=Xanthobacter cornucopiae TaxID=3119924 RepID=UPI0037274F12
MLVYDRTGSGDVDNPQAFQFTQYSPGATSDMEALADVFDTNDDGRLDASDDQWSKFKVQVTGSTGTQVLKTMDELGITEILLTADDNGQMFSDGSQILGSATFVRNGVARAAADTVLAYDTEDDSVQRSSTKLADGSTLVGVKAYGVDGTLSKHTLTTLSADGLTRTIEQDLDADGLFEQKQTQVTVKSADGSRTVTQSNYDAADTLTSRTVTTRSADGKDTWIKTDSDGNGKNDRVEHRLTTGGTTVTIDTLAPDGTTLIDRTLIVATRLTASGHKKTVRSDINGDGTYEVTQTDETVVNADGSEVETIATVAGTSNTLVSRTEITTLKDKSRTTANIDSDGDGTVDLTRVTSLITNDQTGTKTSELVSTANGTRIGRTVTTIQNGGLTRTEQSYLDMNGGLDDGADRITRDQTVVQSNGTSTRTISVFSGDDTTQLSREVTTWSADGRTRAITTDANGDNQPERTENITITSDGGRKDVVSLYAGNTLTSCVTTVTSADGKSSTVTSAFNVAGTIDQTQTVTTITNASGTVATTVATYDGAGTASSDLRNKTVSLSSADGLSTTTRWDRDGNGTFDGSQTDTVAQTDDGGRKRTVEVLNANGTLRSATVSTVSADRLISRTSEDLNGDRLIDRDTRRTTQPDGEVVTKFINYNINRKVQDISTVTTSADGLTVDSSWDVNGDGVDDSSRIESKVHGADGSITQSVKAFEGTTFTQSSVVTTTGNGLKTTTKQNLDGDIATNGIDVTDVTIVDETELLANGSTRRTITNTGNRVLEAQTSVIETRGDGLSTTTKVDVDGDGTFERKTTDVTTINANGDTTRSVTVENDAATPALISRETTTIDAHGAITVLRDIDGDGDTEQKITTSRTANGITRVIATDHDENGAQKDKALTDISADGLSITTRWFQGPDNTIDRTQTDVTVRADDASTTRTLTSFKAANVKTAQVVIWRNADGLNDTTKWE